MIKEGRSLGCGEIGRAMCACVLALNSVHSGHISGDILWESWMAAVRQELLCACSEHWWRAPGPGVWDLLIHSVRVEYHPDLWTPQHSPDLWGLSKLELSSCALPG